METGNSKEPKAGASKATPKGQTKGQTKATTTRSKSAATTGSPKTSQKPKTETATTGKVTKASAPKKAAPGKSSSNGTISLEDIQLRAYYLGEARAKAGIPGDSDGDWLKAEQELKAEAKAAKSSGKKNPPKKAAK